MAIYCTACGTELPDEAGYCWKCGRPQGKPGAAVPIASSQARWEYQDLVVPLNFRVSSWSGYTQRIAEKANPIILRHLQQVGQEGWQVDGPSDFSSLWSSGFAKVKLVDLNFNYKVYSATLRLKRLVQ